MSDDEGPAPDEPALKVFLLGLGVATLFWKGPALVEAIASLTPRDLVLFVDGIVNWLVTPSISPLGVLEIFFFLFIIVLCFVIVPVAGPRL